VQVGQCKDLLTNRLQAKQYHNANNIIQGIPTGMTKKMALWQEILFGRFDGVTPSDNSVGRSALTVSVKILILRMTPQKSFLIFALVINSA